MKFHTVADGVSIAAGLATLAVLTSVYWPHTDPLPRFDEVRLDPEIGIDFTARPRTLVMVLRSGCGYCQESTPFYRRVLAHDAADVQTVVAAPSDDAGIGSYLAAASLKPDSVVLVDPDRLPVPSTLTLLLVDGDGLVTHVWIGLLDAEREAAVLDALVG